MTKILCFGDSNTWGYQANSGKRFAKGQRWPGILARLIGNQVQVIENGLPGRTTYLSDNTFGFRSGIDDLLTELSQQRPDWLIIMLGTNDLFPGFGLNAAQVASKLEKLLIESQTHCTQQHIPQPKMLIVAPPAINNSGSFAELFKGAEYQSQLLSTHYQRLAGALNFSFLNAAEYLSAKLEDGVHMNAIQHKALAEAITQKVLSGNERLSTKPTSTPSA